MNDNLKILVAYSFDSEILDCYNDNKFLKIGLGDFKSEKMDINETDYEGNIASINKYINEFTAIDFANKHYDSLGNPEYIGLFQYRRKLNIDNLSLKPKQIICNRFDLLPNIFDQYKKYHNIDDLKNFLSGFHDKFPFLSELMKCYLEQQIFYRCNLFVMHKDLFFEFSKFIETCIEICIEKVIPRIIKNDKYQIRAAAFILERMTSFWIWHKMKSGDVSIQDANIIEYNINSPYKKP